MRDKKRQPERERSRKERAKERGIKKLQRAEEREVIFSIGLKVLWATFSLSSSPPLTHSLVKPVLAKEPINDKCIFFPV